MLCRLEATTFCTIGVALTLMNLTKRLWSLLRLFCSYQLRVNYILAPAANRSFSGVVEWTLYSETACSDVIKELMREEDYSIEFLRELLKHIKDDKLGELREFFTKYFGVYLNDVLNGKVEGVNVTRFFYNNKIRASKGAPIFEAYYQHIKLL